MMLLVTGGCGYIGNQVPVGMLNDGPALASVIDNPRLDSRIPDTFLSSESGCTGTR
jgi:UDP-glucose 4-epimerase